MFYCSKSVNMFGLAQYILQTNRFGLDFMRMCRGKINNLIIEFVLIGQKPAFDNDVSMM